MSVELNWLILSVLVTALLWLPYIINRIAEGGVVETVLRDPNGLTAAKAPWAKRLMAAHVNAVENLVVFAPLVLVAYQLGISNPMTEFAAVLFFYSRLAHAVVFTLGFPAIIRILAFFGGFVAQMLLIYSLLG